MFQVTARFARTTALAMTLAIAGTIGATAFSADAQARVTQCWRGTGGYYCY